MAEKSKALGTGGRNEQSLQTLKYDLPESNSVDDIVTTIREILVRHTSIHKLTMIAGKQIEVQVAGTDTEGPEGEQPVLLAEIIRKVELETVASVSQDPTAILGDVLQTITVEGLFGVFIVVGNRQRFSRWFTHGKQGRLKKAMGMTIHDAPGTLTEDSVVICAAATRIAIPTEVVKGYLVRSERPTIKERQI